MSANADFETIYVRYYARMKRFAVQYVLREEDAENLVQDVFTELWERFPTLSSHDNLFAYLVLAIKNRCIDFLRRQTVMQKAADAVRQEYELEWRANHDALLAMGTIQLSETELDGLLQRALDKLPERCREIFVKSKIEGIKQKDIAAALGISVNTVENQVAIAYRKLRAELKHLFPLIFFILF